MPRGRPVSLSIVELERMLEARRSSVAKLQRKRDGLMRRVEKLDQQIAAAGGSAAGEKSASRTAGGRVRNAMSLGDTIASLMQSKGPMSVGDVLEAVVASGYRSGSSNFRGIVNQTLIKDKRFGSAGRSMYAMK